MCARFCLSSDSAKMSKIGKTCALPGCGKTGDSATGKLRVCGGCGVVAYCTVEHQKEHWAKHKQECKQQHKKDSDPLAGHLRKGSIDMLCSKFCNSGQSSYCLDFAGKADKDVPVTWDDQKLINRFGLLNARLQDLLDELKESEVCIYSLFLSFCILSLSASFWL
jgi:hypothetical protein